jgi:hypothetical protein
MSAPQRIDHAPPGSGLAGPFALRTDGWRECVAQWKGLRQGDGWRRAGLLEAPYEKAAHAHVPACRSLAMQPGLLSRAREIVGSDDLMLATMSVLVKPPGWEHRWHSDVENAIDRLRCNDTSWTVWLPLSGATADSSMLMVTHTHASHDLAQALVTGCKLCDRGDNFSSLKQRGSHLVRLARARGMRDASLVQLAAVDGEAWAFRGATWHASLNAAPRARVAVQFHFMPTRCKFRTHLGSGWKLQNNAPPLPTAARPRPHGIGAVLPPVIPLEGSRSATLRSAGEEATQNNWMRPDEPEPAVADAAFDRTPTRARQCSYKRYSPSTGARELSHALNASGWVNKLCALKQGVDARAGAVDATKCKTGLLKGHTAQLRIIEYHTSKLRQNFAAHEMRTHEELELLYVLHGTILISLKQAHAPLHTPIRVHTEEGGGGGE